MGPYRDLQNECRSRQVSISYTDNQMALTKRLAKAKWPPAPDPTPAPTKPKPRSPRPQLRPPPPRPRPTAHEKPLVPPPPHFTLGEYYKALGLSPSAGVEDVKKAFRKLALLWHPDKNQGLGQKHAAQEFRKIAEAYEKLTEHL